MSEMRVSDPSRLHLKKELTQIRKAARVLRDPGTTSSWKSHLNSSARSAAALAHAAAAASSTSSWKKQQQPHLENGNNECGNSSTTRNDDKEKRVFLYNWKMSQKSFGDKSGMASNDADEGGEEEEEEAEEEEEFEEDYEPSISVQDSLVDDSMSDARNFGDYRSDTTSRSTSIIFRCRDANLVPPSVRPIGIRRKGKKMNNTHLDILSRYQEKEMNLRRLLKAHPSKAKAAAAAAAAALGRDDSVEQQSDDTEDYLNSEYFRKISGASPLLSKLKHKNWSHSQSKLLLRRSSPKEDSSYSHSTPAMSASSYSRYCNRNPSTVGSWDATTTSLNDGDDEVDDQLDLPGRQGCGIPCYWSRRTPRHRGVCGSCHSPSLSESIRRKGSSMLCGGQSMYHRPRHSSISKKHRIATKSAQGLLPLLTNGVDVGGGSSIETGCSEDELSTNFGELDLEALSRLDGKRWSSCRSEDGLGIVPLNADPEEEGSPENMRSLSQKYRPVSFGQLIGQNIVVQSLMNSISRGRIAPVYLFQGPRGTGKTSTARIFATALNCISTEEMKPCGYCSQCSAFISGKTKELWEVDGTNKKGIDRVRYLLKKVSQGSLSGFSNYKVFLIDECHLLPSKMWLAFLKFLEDPPQGVVFIFITTDPDNVPRIVQSRCQKYLFNKIKDGDIVERLKKITAEENLDVELDALDLIALNADGSLRDAETMLDQLSLLGKRITTSLVHELVGVVSDEKLLELLELAMSSDTAETVKRARDLMDSGVDPMVLMSQLASLIMDIIAGTYQIDIKYSDLFFHGRSLTEAEMERLKHALKLLSEAEKQLRVSSDRSTWFTATLLQLGSVPSPDLTRSSSSRRQSSQTTEEDPSSTSRDANIYKLKSEDAQHLLRRSSSPASLQKALNGHSSRQGEFGFSSKPTLSQLVEAHASSASQDSEMVKNFPLRHANADKLDDIWRRCIVRCHSKTLRQLLHAHGKLFSISEVGGILVAYVAFGDKDIKARAERFLSSITNSIEMVLRHNVEVRLLLVSDADVYMHCTSQKEFQGEKQIDATLGIERESNGMYSDTANVYSDLDSQQEPLKLCNGNVNDLGGKLKGNKPSGHSTTLSTDLLPGAYVENGGVIPVQRIESIIREQRLETAWLQAADKGTPGSLSRLRPEKNQVLPQDDICHQNQMESTSSVGLSSRQWEDELNKELNVLKTQDQKLLNKDQIGKSIDCCPISPTLLHDTGIASNANKESLGYESSSATGDCSALFCWNVNRSHRGKARGTPVHSRRKAGRFMLFHACAKPRKNKSSIRRQ